MRQHHLLKSPALLNSFILLLSTASTSAGPIAVKSNYSAFAEKSRSTQAKAPLIFNELIDSSRQLSMEPTLGLPNFLWANTVSATNAKLQTTNLEATARAHLARYADIYRLSPGGLKSAKFRDVQRLGKNGAIVRFTQQVNGIDVYERQLNLLMDDSSALTAISGYLAPQQISTARIAASAFKLTVPQAITAAFADLYNENLPQHLLSLVMQHGDYQWHGLSSPLPNTFSHTLNQPVRSKKVYYPLPDTLVPAYYLELSASDNSSDASSAYAYVISAVDGELLSRTNLIAFDATPFSYRTWADDAELPLPYDSPYGTDLTPFPPAAPEHPATPVAANLISIGCGPISTCDPWLPATAGHTVGNNVDAYADITRPSGFNHGDFRAPISAANTFDYAYDFTEFDSDNRPEQIYPALIQAFYTTNFLHDWLYNHGFNEQAGNGQDQNYGRGGEEVDRMHVEINDFSDTDNANMTTPLDGASATMQLFLWSHNGAKYLLIKKPDGSNHKYRVSTASFGPQNFRLKSKELVVINDNIGTTSDACDTPISSAVSGKIAVIDRGSCFFAEKVKHAQDVGAIAAIIVNNASGPMIPMGNSGNPDTDNAIIIPTLGIAKAHGDAIKQQLNTTPALSADMLRKVLPPYNSALDNTIVVHEWGHFLSRRLITRLANNQGNSLGEGWSDFLALLAAVRPEDQQISNNTQFQAAYPLGQYVAASQPKDYFFGIRRYPYSTDVTINPLTFKHIMDGVAIPTSIPTLFIPGANSEVHNSGEVWATMLWEAYTQLLTDSGRLSFIEARNRMLDYLVASLKMTPPNPTFLEARDALLAVAKARDSADYNAFWRAFAKRGAGVNAKGPKRFSLDHAGVIEDFTHP